jgi:hypothetical protein
MRASNNSTVPFTPKEIANGIMAYLKILYKSDSFGLREKN